MQIKRIHENFSRQAIHFILSLLRHCIISVYCVYVYVFVAFIFRFRFNDVKGGRKEEFLNYYFLSIALTLNDKIECQGKIRNFFSGEKLKIKKSVIVGFGKDSRN